MMKGVLTQCHSLWRGQQRIPLFQTARTLWPEQLCKLFEVNGGCHFLLLYYTHLDSSFQPLFHHTGACPTLLKPPLLGQQVQQCNVGHRTDHSFSRPWTSHHHIPLFHNFRQDGLSVCLENLVEFSFGQCSGPTSNSLWTSSPFYLHFHPRLSW